MLTSDDHESNLNLLENLKMQIAFPNLWCYDEPPSAGSFDLLSLAAEDTASPPALPPIPTDLHYRLSFIPMERND